MEKAFRPLPLEGLARWVFGELESGDTVLGIPVANFQIPDPRLASRLQGHTLAAPLGLAAGPHTQLAQNIVAGWLCGARFIELKTVQALDEIAVSRPCIDAADEAYNCEWSQELKLEQSFREYLHAWVLIHALAHRLGLKEPGTHFAMSVGYTLEGIQSPRVQRFIAELRDAGEALPAAVEAVAAVYPAIRGIDIPRRISNHITLSTMHGCPPAEIERIARYLLLDLGVDTWVKLNPTLLGPERLRGILNGTMGHAIQVPDSAFAHDPGFEDAMAMARSLARAAEGLPQRFGLKLSNTLEVVNHRGVFPASEPMMYLSGRALHPLTLTLAKRVSDATEGRVPISFCGGADAWNVADLVADGLGPVTVCTDLLKPGGYARLQAYLVNLGAAMDEAGADSLEAFIGARSGGRGARSNLARHAERVLEDRAYARRERPLDFKAPRPLGAFDCIAAPCQEACPAHQNIPDYLWQVAQGRPGEALDVILRSNPLPGITGSICDHPCTERCVRNFLDAPLEIRAIKRFAFEEGRASALERTPAKDVRVAIVGAGPAGISAAYHLARLGFQAELFEAKGHAGGMVGGAVPRYRMADGALDVDLARLTELGVKVHLGRALGRDLDLRTLRQQFPFVFLGLGAQRGRRLGLEGEDAAGVMDALAFLDRVRAGENLELGDHVLVVGGGNSAMDAARSARRLAPEARVTVVYRRTRSEMPADPEEVRDCLLEGIEVRELLAPARVVVEGGKATGLACTPMALGEPDASGRPRPVPSGEAEVVLPADLILPALGQEVVLDCLAGLELKRHGDGTLVADPATGETSLPGLYAGGDVVRGPATVIKAVADGRAAAEAIGRRHGVVSPEEPALAKPGSPAARLARKAWRVAPQTVPSLPAGERRGFREVHQGFAPEAARAEARRCLDCDVLCSLCVTVCPNRANQAYATVPMALELPVLVARGERLVAEGSKTFAIRQAVQILNLGDSCNACGNCDTFCPTADAPYRRKPQFWIDPEGFEASPREAYRMRREGETLHLEARLPDGTHRLACGPDSAEYRCPRLRVRLSPGAWELLEAGLLGPAAEGESFDLSPLAHLIALLAAEPALHPFL